MLTGVMEVNGFLLKQETGFRALYSPSNCSHLTLTALDANPHVEGSAGFLKSPELAGGSSRFYPASQATQPNEVRVDLEPVDAERLNAMIAAGGWRDVAVVMLLKATDSALTRCLEAQDGVLPSFVSRPLQCVCVCVNGGVTVYAYVCAVSNCFFALGFTQFVFSRHALTCRSTPLYPAFRW